MRTSRTFLRVPRVFAGLGVARLLRQIPLVAALVAFAILLTGCLTLGQSRVLGFDYKARDSLFGHHGIVPLAAGAAADIEVNARRTGSETAETASGEKDTTAREDFHPIDVLRARSDAPEVVTIESVRGSLVRVRGVSPGVATLFIETEIGADTLRVDVAAAASSALEHWTWSLLAGQAASRTAFLATGTGRFLCTLRDAAGRPLAGFGVAAPSPVSPSGAAIADPIADGDLDHLDIHFPTTGTLTLPGPPRTATTVQVIAKEDVLSIHLVTVDPSSKAVVEPSALRIGQERVLVARGELRDGREVLLLGGVVHIASRTPDICPTPRDLAEHLHLFFGDGAAVFYGASEGSCVVEATLGALRTEATLAVEAK